MGKLPYGIIAHYSKMSERNASHSPSLTPQRSILVGSWEYFLI